MSIPRRLVIQRITKEILSFSAMKKDKNGIGYVVGRGSACMDSAELTHAYGHRMRGSQAVLLIWSLASNKPVMAIWHPSSVFMNNAFSIFVSSSQLLYPIGENLNIK